MAFLTKSLLLFYCLMIGMLAPVAAADDQLGPGDSIRITVFQNPNLTTEARISARGLIWFPLIGDVEMAGLTQAEAVATISEKLKKGRFLVDPQVSISVLQVRSRQVSVIGQVQRPGRYALEEGTARLTDILALAGGVTPDGHNVVSIIGGSEGEASRRDIDLSRLYQNSNPAGNIELQGGETVIVERAPVFYIYGQVQRAGAYRLAEKLNVMQAVSLAGGVAPRGTERGIRIHRQADTGGVEDIGATLSDSVHANDVIRVPERLF
jgi:polysaccharide export outer membrane protein